MPVLPQLGRNYEPVSKLKIEKALLEGHEYDPGSNRRKRLRLSQVSAATRVQILKMAATKTRTHAEIGELFDVRTSTVS